MMSLQNLWFTCRSGCKLCICVDESMKIYPRITRAKQILVLCVVAVVTGLFGLISNEYLLNGKAVEERPPNRALYNSVLSRDLNSLILSKPNIPEQSKVIVLVCTKPNSFDVRMAIRETWANPLLSKAVNDNFVSVVFLIGTGFVGDSVKNEIQTSNDILQVDLHDSYSNLVYKLLAAYRWIAAHHSSKFVLKIDSDVVILLDKVIETLNFNTSAPSMYCFVHRFSVPDRQPGSRWYIPPSIYPPYYLPDYCSGPIYMMSPTALSAILALAPKAQVFEVEDAFFTGVLAQKAGVQRRVERGIWNRPKRTQPCVGGVGTLIGYPVHSVGPLDLVKSWQQLQSVRCRWPVEHFVLTLLYDD
ncbi:hypothetical protein Q1695_014573 [Nippostrongylus brasiliensis]|nr:hypothetical protein Q1695_014573 [Nippostrongylus brasiliensis]